jgi:hypothetical protein
MLVHQTRALQLFDAGYYWNRRAFWPAEITARVRVVIQYESWLKRDCRRTLDQATTLKQRLAHRPVMFVWLISHFASDLRRLEADA